MRWFTDFCTLISLVDWWPTRLPLLVVTIGLLGALVWRFRSLVARLTLIPLLTVLLALDVLLGVNAYFGYNATLADALGMTNQSQGSLAALARQKNVPPDGALVNVDVPSLSSGFQARPASVYLPPAWFARPRPKLPVIMLLHGTPGGPTDWLDAGAARQTAERWARAHGGVSPIVVMPDVNGDVLADTECVDSARGNAESYLTNDVPRFVRSNFLTRDPGEDWAVAGLSEGGSCAVMLALRHHDLFGTFADFGGLIGPRDGDTNAPDHTADALFGGSQQNLDAHEPVWLLTHRRFTGLHGFFVVGDNDPQPLAATHRLVALARQAGIATEQVIIPGGQHTWDVWRTAFADALPVLTHDLTTTPETAITAHAGG